MQQFQNILFDLDGTIIDSHEGITRSVEYALKELGCQVKDRNSLLPFIGPPLLDSFKNCSKSCSKIQRTLQQKGYL